MNLMGVVYAMTGSLLSLDPHIDPVTSPVSSPHMYHICPSSRGHGQSL